MIYADEFFYRGEYGGTIPDPLSLLRKGSQAVDRATLFRIRDFDRLPELARHHVRMAVCIMADFYGAQGDMADIEGVTSYSIGDVSVSLENTDETFASYGVTQAAYVHLWAAGLMYRGV